MSFVRRLTAEQIDQVVALLLSKNEEYLALGGTGRIGAGYGHRDGVFYALAVDDELRGPPAEVSFKSEGRSACLIRWSTLALRRSTLPIKSRLDNIIKNGLTVLIGDANGADKTVQQYLASKHYQCVMVYCVGTRCRNNVGNWPVRYLRPPQEVRRDFSYYATKDRAMVDDTDYGLMVWDGDSRGTLTSIVDLLGQGKPTAVYVARRKTFELRSCPRSGATASS